MNPTNTDPMSDTTPTPITNSAAFHLDGEGVQYSPDGGYVGRDTAEKLERELTSATDQLAAVTRELTEAQEATRQIALKSYEHACQRDGVVAERIALAREADALREQVAKLHENWSIAQKLCSQGSDRIAELRAEVATWERRYSVSQSALERAKDGMRLVAEIVDEAVPNPGCELDTVDLVRRLREQSATWERQRAEAKAESDKRLERLYKFQEAYAMLQIEIRDKWKPLEASLRADLDAARQEAVQNEAAYMELNSKALKWLTERDRALSDLAEARQESRAIHDSKNTAVNKWVTRLEKAESNLSTANHALAEMRTAIAQSDNHYLLDESERQTGTTIAPLDDPECFCLRCCAIRALSPLPPTPDEPAGQPSAVEPGA